MQKPQSTQKLTVMGCRSRVPIAGLQLLIVVQDMRLYKAASRELCCNPISAAQGKADFLSE